MMDEKTFEYEDIVNLKRPVSKKHQPMSMESRSAQFAPFAALVGYEKVIEDAKNNAECMYQKSPKLNIK